MVLLMIFAIFVFGLMGTQLFREKFENPEFELQTLHPYETIFTVAERSNRNAGQLAQFADAENYG